MSQAIEDRKKDLLASVGDIYAPVTPSSEVVSTEEPVVEDEAPEVETDAMDDWKEEDDRRRSEAEENSEESEEDEEEELDQTEDEEEESEEEEEESEEEEVIDEEPSNIQTLRTQLKEKGREVKEAEGKIAEKDAEIAELQSRLSETEEDLDGHRRMNIDPQSDPQIVQISQDLQRDLSAAKLTLKTAAQARALDEHSNELSNLFLAYTDGEPDQQDQAAANLKARVRELFGDPDAHLGLEEGEVPEISKDERAVMSFLANVSPKVSKIHERANELSRRAKDGVDSVVSQNYKSLSKEVSLTVEPLISMTEKTATNALERKVVAAAQDKAKVKAALETVNLVFAGIEPLGENEIESVKASSGGIKAWNASKKRALADARQKAQRSLFQMLLLGEELDSLVEAGASDGEKKAKKRRTRAAVDNLKKKGSSKKKAAPEKKRDPRERMGDLVSDIFARPN